jgi:hypothetical protein
MKKKFSMVYVGFILLYPVDRSVVLNVRNANIHELNSTDMKISRISPDIRARSEGR